MGSNLFTIDLGLFGLRKSTKTEGKSTFFSLFYNKRKRLTCFGNAWDDFPDGQLLFPGANLERVGFLCEECL